MRLTSWVARDGTEKHGISVVAEQIASAKPIPQRRSSSPARRPPQRRQAFPPGAPPPDDPLDDLYVAEVVR
jgi:hypothetical protein